MNTQNFPPFAGWPSITRYKEQNIVITEKIDGTNAIVFIPEDLSFVVAGSRNRWITPEDDNYGFAKFVKENAEDLKLLGPGYHYGEWWGQGIQRGYNMSQKVFSLFNAGRWSDSNERPSCCDVVPVLGVYTASNLEEFVMPEHSVASQKYGVEFKPPEGYILYWTKSKVYYKVPLTK